MNIHNSSKYLPSCRAILLTLVCLCSFSGINAKEFIITSTDDAVDSLPGDGDCNGEKGCTLRAAIMEANALVGADSINLSNAIYTLSIVGIEENENATGDLDITEELIINGAGATIDAASLDRIFDVHRVPVKLDSLTLKNGLSNVEAGAIRAIRSDLDLNNISFTDNIAGGVGGGLYAGGGKLTINNSNFRSNSSASGGGLFTERSSLEISGGSFIDNTAIEGGALNVAYPEEFKLTGVNFEDNASTGNGGAIYLEGTAAESDEQYIIESNTFKGNMTSGGVGGALYVEHLYGASSTTEATLLIDSSTFTESKALGGAAIWMNKSLLTVSDSTFTGNIAVDSVGGGIYSFDVLSVTNSTFTDNYTEDLGAAIYADDELNIAAVTATNNTTFNSVGEGIYRRLNALLEDTDNDGTADNKDEFPLDKNEQIDTDDDGIGNNADTDDDGDGIADIDDPFPLDSTLPDNKDTDGDNVPDKDDAFPNDPLETVDTDNDGLGNNADTDDDGDGILDVDELRYGSNPLSNLDTPDDHRPLKPEILGLTANAVMPLSLFDMQVTDFSDPDENGLASAIEVKIEGPLDDGSTGAIFHRKLNPDNLQKLQLPDGLLDTGTTYQVSVSHQDATGQHSEFSQPFALSTSATDPMDTNANLIEDSAEPNGEVDIDNNGVSDSDEGITVVINAENGDLVGISSNAGKISHVSVMRKADLPEALMSNEATKIPLGLFGFRISDISPGSTVKVAVLTLLEIPADYRWYQYDPNAGLIDITALTSLDGKTLSITYVDGGAGDLDGVENGRIIDPSGPTFTLTAIDPVIDGESDSGNGLFGLGCSFGDGSGNLDPTLLLLVLLSLLGIYRKRIVEILN